MKQGTRVTILSDCFYGDYDDEGRQVHYVPAGTIGTVEEFDSLTMDIEEQPGTVIVAPDDFDLVIQIPVGEVEPILDSDFGYSQGDIEFALSECGMTSNGDCMLAGTEFCDWHCRIDWS